MFAEGPELFRVSIDIGGTFTDLVAFDEITGELLNFKVPSVPRKPEEGVIESIKLFLRGTTPDSITVISHATTIGTNALFGQIDLELPKTAFITTKGFRDVVEIGRQRRPELYNLFFRRPPTLVERRFRYEVQERIDPKGNVITPINSADVEEILNEIEAKGIESLAIGFLNSYANQKHELEVLEAARRRIPDLHLTASSNVSNEYREYERFSTSVVNAVLMPIIESYLSRLESGLKDMGIGSPLYVMQSNGGMAKAEVIKEKPATIVESGPAAGVIAAAWLGEQVGEYNVISFDMGGTTAKAGSVRGRLPEVVSEYEVAGKIHMGRLVKGSGYPVRFPFIDLAECSAGGGTIASADEGGALNVGPISAGAIPGPACYGKGGDEPTITDANLILGRLNPEELLGGDMRIFPELARRAFEGLCSKLGINVEEAAVSVVRIANSMMAKILKIVSVERGFDPRNFALVAFGGAGPMHACALSEELQIGRVIVPQSPGLFSAIGLLTADLSHDYVKAIIKQIEAVNIEDLEQSFMEMESEGSRTLVREGIDAERMRFIRQLDLRYLGQAYELTVQAMEPFDGRAFQAAIAAFHKKHRDTYGYSAENEKVEVVNARLRAIGEIPKPHLKETNRKVGDLIPKSSRSVFFEGADSWLESPIYDRGSLCSGSQLGGPAVVEQYDSTVVIYPDWHASVDRFGNLLLRKGSQ